MIAGRDAAPRRCKSVVHARAGESVAVACDPITIAELLGHARLETTRAYSRPTHEDRAERSTCLTSTSS